MTLERMTLQKITPFLISVKGQWSPGLARDWCGWASASEPLVALVFVCSSGGCGWIKSERGDATIQVRLALFPDVGPGRDVSASFSVGRGNAIGRSTVPSAVYRPVVPEQQTFQSGVIQKFTQVIGDPSLDLLILFLARRDVRSARNGLWHLRPELAESISSEPIRRMMTYGRTGHLPGSTI
jgi:hypothetical protein